MTNHDNFKNMSIEELSALLAQTGICALCVYNGKPCNTKCKNGIKKWLKSEVKND